MVGVWGRNKTTLTWQCQRTPITPTPITPTPITPTPITRPSRAHHATPLVPLGPAHCDLSTTAPRPPVSVMLAAPVPAMP